MCGICGIIRKDEKAVDPDLIRRMCSTMVHRGPDDEGVHTEGNVGLGMRRLKIIDLKTGHQPIFNEDRTVWIVFNGEIYNYQELRPGLLDAGHKFSTQTDTEVILHLYEEYGEKCLEHLNGMFCFAIWDSKTKKMFIARDRLGIKQLYYYDDGAMFIFGSEIKVVLSALKNQGSINFQALSDYLSLLYVPAPHTIYSDIKKLPPAHSLVADQSSIRIKKYWHLEYSATNETLNSLIRSTSDKISHAVKLQMISDVPLGAFLSGGVDSSILVAMMAKQSSRPVETFSILWDKDAAEFDEREYSRLVSKMYKTSHHEFLVSPDIEELTEHLVRSFDEPFADASAIPNYYLCKETRKHVTVALSGLGGDEIAGGYERYLGMAFMQYYRKLPGFVRNSIVSNLVRSIPDSKAGKHFNNRLKRFAAFSDLPYDQAYFSFVSEYPDNVKISLFSDDVLTSLRQSKSTFSYFDEYAEESGCGDDLNKLLYIDMNTYLVDDLLTLSDRMSMQHSLEMRVPFLDHTIVEHFAQVNQNLKIHGFSKKIILKKIAENLLPNKLIYRKKKGFSVPLVLWFRGKLKPYVLEILNEKSIKKAGLLNAESVNNILNQHFGGQENNDEKIWALMCLMIWYNKYVNKVY
jgi:asparagine synthase (glutamine-hydrolysing)